MRKFKNVVVPFEGRDHGKMFKITEMPALQAEKWARRAFWSMVKSGFEIPEDIREAGIAGLAMLSIRALTAIDFETSEILMDELMGCVQVVRDKSKPDIVQDPLPIDFEEVKTILWLKDQVFELHTGFSFVGESWNSTSATESKAASS